MLWAYFYCYQLTLDMHEKELQCALNSINEMRDIPIVVYSDKANSVMQANEYAMKEGVELGHGLAQTAALCPHVKILEFDHSVEKDVLTQLAHRLYPLASDIVLDSHNSIAIRLDNLMQYYGGLEPLWHVLTREIELAHINYHFSTAWGIEAARLLAQNKTNQRCYNKEKITQLLAKCPLSLAALNHKDIATLAKVGVRQVGQLLSMPIHELGQRFSNDTIRYLTALRGETFPKSVLFRPSEAFQQTKNLPFDVENTHHLLPYIEALLLALEQYLRARNLLSSTVLFSVHFREAEALTIEVNAAMPLSAQKNWLTLVALKFESLLLSEPATAISLMCQRFENIENDSSDFFSHRFTTVAQKQLIGRLKAKLGDNCTVHPKAGDSNMFESMSVDDTQAGTSPYICDIAPSFLFAKPMPLTFSTRICFGPLRIHTGWWSNTGCKQDYFIAQTQQGVRLLVFKDSKAKWWTQGIYC